LQFWVQNLEEDKKPVYIVKIEKLLNSILDTVTMYLRYLDCSLLAIAAAFPRAAHLLQMQYRNLTKS